MPLNFTPPLPAATSVPRRTWLACAVLFLGVAMALLDTTIVNVALPVIGDSVGANEATLSWIVSGYALTYGLALIPAGRVGDRFGHKLVFIVGLAIFTLASLWAGLAQDSTSLVVARIVQGLGGGIFFPSVTAFIQLMFPGRLRGRAFAVMGAVIGVSTALGPLLGGLLIEWLGNEQGWRSIFFVNLPFGLIALVAAFLLLPGGAESSHARGADLVGLVLLAGALTALLVPLIQGQEEGWPLWTYLSLGGGVVLLVVFALWEVFIDRRKKNPLVPPRLFSHPAFTGGTILALVYFAAFTSIFFTITIFWQSGLGYSALESGFVAMPFAIGSILGAWQSDRLARRLGRAVLSIGTGLVAVGLISVWIVLMVVPAPELDNWDMLVPLLVAGVGSGMFIAPNTQFIVATVDRTEAGAASGVIGTVQRIGAAIGVAAVGSVFFGNLPADFGPTEEQAREIVQEHGGDGAQAVKDAIQAIVDYNLAVGFDRAATIALFVSACLSIVAFVLVLTLPKQVPPRH